MAVRVDVRARLFESDDNAWRLFPGSGYRHYECMREFNRVFLDMPDLPFVSLKPLEKDTETVSSLARSIAVSPFVFRNDEHAERRYAEEMARDFSNARWSQKRNLALGWVNGLYSQAKIGDVVVVPGPGFRKNKDGEFVLLPTLVGEIIGQTERWNERGPAEYLRARLLTRRIRWFEDVSEDQLSPKAVLSLRTQNALVKVPPEELEGVLGAAFKNVVTDNETLARFVTNNSDFRSFEALQFLAFVQATCAAIRASKLGKDLEGKSIYEIAGNMERDRMYVVEQDASIHSPGYSTLKLAFESGGQGIKSIPLVIACLFALANEASANPFDADNKPNVKVLNTESANLDPCDPYFGIEQDVRDTLDVIGYDRWKKQWCPAAKAAQDNEGFRSLSTVAP